MPQHRWEEIIHGFNQPMPAPRSQDLNGSGVQENHIVPLWQVHEAVRIFINQRLKCLWLCGIFTTTSTTVCCRHHCPDTVTTTALTFLKMRLTVSSQIDAFEPVCVTDKPKSRKVKCSNSLRVGKTGLLESRWAACWRILRHTLRHDAPPERSLTIYFFLYSAFIPITQWL